MGRRYDTPPWIFKGRALYQLQFVRVEEVKARKYIPEELKVVSLFGYTLGGFYLARYSDSPTGAFDECVALAGLVWNKATSCAWAARVYVNNREARDHGRKHVGLPSRVCRMDSSLIDGAEPKWWGMNKEEARKFDRLQYNPGEEARGSTSGQNTDAESPVIMYNTERRQSWWPFSKGRLDQEQKSCVCSFKGFPPGHRKKGPRIKLCLPSFSGKTTDVPTLLRYACNLTTHVRMVKPVQVSCPDPSEVDDREDMRGVLGGKPLMALAFDDMIMVVHKPVADERAATNRMCNTIQKPQHMEPAVT